MQQHFKEGKCWLSDERVSLRCIWSSHPGLMHCQCPSFHLKKMMLQSNASLQRKASQGALSLWQAALIFQSTLRLSMSGIHTDKTARAELLQYINCLFQFLNSWRSRTNRTNTTTTPNSSNNETCYNGVLLIFCIKPSLIKLVFSCDIVSMYMCQFSSPTVVVSSDFLANIMEAKSWERFYRGWKQSESLISNISKVSLTITYSYSSPSWGEYCWQV